MKSILHVAALVVLASNVSAFAKEAGTLDPTGTWLTEDGRAKVRVEKCGADHTALCGEVVWLREPLDENGKPKTDIKNPDPAKRSRPALGMPLFKDLKVDDDQIYSGDIYNADNGKSYSVTFHVDKPSDLHVKGCMLSVLCGSQHWARVNDMPVSVVQNAAPKGAKAKAPAQQ